jgi:hypothetical protein
MHRHSSFLSSFLIWVSLLSLTGCATSRFDSLRDKETPWEKASSLELASSARPGSVAPDVWQHRTFPGKKPNQFAYSMMDGRPSMAV